MEMQQVRYFVVLAETLNFTRAAERCNVSQPSLTRAIKLLEDELGGPLFHRERNNTHLTELGRQVEPFLKRVQQETEGARAKARALAKLQTVELRIGLSRGTPLSPLLGAIHRFADAHPSAEIALPSAEPDELLEALRRGEVEVIVVPCNAAEPDDLHYYRLAPDAPRLILPEGHRLAGPGPVELAELAQESIASVQGCAHWEIVRGRLEAAGMTARPRILVGRQQWLLDIVRAGLAVGLVSRHHDPGPGLVARELEVVPDELGVHLATKRGRLYSPPVKAFVEIALTPARG